MSRFDDLFKSKGKPVSNESRDSKSADPSSPLPKSKDPDYVRTTVYLPKQLHRQLKSLAAQSEQEMSEIVEASLVQYLKQLDE